MDKETKDIIRLIAGIQIESLTSLKPALFCCLSWDEALLRNLLQIEDEEILFALDQEIERYVTIERYPTFIKMLNEYQLMICSHILFKMEDEWLIDNAQGVCGAWALLHKIQIGYHPEITLLKI